MPYTIGLESHWPCIADLCGYLSMDTRPKEGRWAPHPTYTPL